MQEAPHLHQGQKARPSTTLRDTARVGAQRALDSPQLLGHPRPSSRTPLCSCRSYTRLLSLSWPSCPASLHCPTRMVQGVASVLMAPKPLHLAWRRPGVRSSPSPSQSLKQGLGAEKQAGEQRGTWSPLSVPEAQTHQGPRENCHPLLPALGWAAPHRVSCPVHSAAWLRSSRRRPVLQCLLGDGETLVPCHPHPRPQQAPVGRHTLLQGLCTCSSIPSLCLFTF